MSAAILDLVAQRVVVFDGAMGTQLIEHGLPQGQCPETWNLTHPAVIQEVHRRYLAAGADVIQTNTFGGTRIKLSRYGCAEQVKAVNQAAVRIAQAAAATKPGAFVAGDIGPTGQLLQPFGDYTEEEFFTAFCEQADALADAGVDFLSIETMYSLEEALLAAKAAKRTGLPIFASLAYRVTPRGIYTMMGAEVGTATKALEEAGVDVVGTNCEIEITAMIHVVQAIKVHTHLPIMAQPNAGQPVLEEGKARYQQQPAAFAAQIPALLQAGARIIGGCCGTTPEFIRLAVAQL
jgi:5-methyltetrahydrofolate--homocysteine methyltransferase